MRLSFEDFELDTERRELRRSGAGVPLEPQVFDLLVALIEQRDRVVSKDALIEQVWGGRIVSDAAVASRIKAARQALDDDGKRQRLIKTSHGRGFRFVGTVRETPAADAAPAADAFPAAPAPTGPSQAPSPGVALRPNLTAAAPMDAPPERRAPEPAAPPNRANRPGIAVLPFAAIGAPGPYAAIAQALPHDLIAALSRLRWLFVIARGSSFRFHSAEADLPTIGAALGADYALTGHVDVLGERITVTTELAECRTGEVIWSERQSGEAGMVHEIRAGLVARIVSSLELRISAREAERARLQGSEHLDAWSSYHLGLQRMYRFTRTDNAAAQACFAQAVRLDPGFARAHAALSCAHFQNALLHYSSDVDAETIAAQRAAEQSLALDDLDPFGHFAKGRAVLLGGDLDVAGAWLDRAAALSPNYAQALYAHGWVNAVQCLGSDSQGRVDEAMALSPLDPFYYAMLACRAMSHLVRGDDAEAARWANKGAAAPGAHHYIYMIAVISSAFAGESGQAEYWVERLKRGAHRVTTEEFLASFPFRDETLRRRIVKELASFGF